MQIFNIHRTISREKADILLEKYYEGFTSVEEERLLQAFLSQPNLPERYEADRDLLGYFARQKSVTKPQAVIMPLVVRWTSIAAALAGAFFLVKTFLPDNRSCYAYIDGQKVTNMEVVKAQAMASLHEISSSPDEVKESTKHLDNDELVKEQLQLFTENK